MSNHVKFSNLSSSPVSSRPSKKELGKSKYYRKNHKKSQNQFSKKKECTYAQEGQFSQSFIQKN